MKTAVLVELAEKPRHGHAKDWRRIALSFALALSMVWTVGATSALAASFGAFALVDIYDRNVNENPGDFFAMDPASSSLPLVLVPEADVYANGATSTAISFGRAGGSGSASSDLATGTLRAFSASSSAGVTDASAGFSDTLTPLATGTLHFDFVINGVITGSQGGGGGWFAWDGNVLYGTRGEIDSCLNEFTSSCSFSVDLWVSAGMPVQFSAAIDAFAVGSTADLSNTATLRATGVPFTSNSGVFLTAVPEPASLLLLGVAAAGLMRRRGRRTTAD